MKALTIHQPWAGLIVLGIKTVENRTMATTHRGLFLVHAGKTVCEWLAEAMRKRQYRWCANVPPDWERHPAFSSGCIIGEVSLTDCVDARMIDHGRTWWHRPNSYWYELANARRIANPLPWRGSQGWFDVPDDAIRQARLPASAGYYQG